MSLAVLVRGALALSKAASAASRLAPVTRAITRKGKTYTATRLMRVDPPIKALSIATAITSAHYGRNLFNRPVSPETIEAEWTELPPAKSVYHKQRGQTANRKYISPSGRKEAVIANGQLVTDHTNRGTFNYASPKMLKGVPHAMLDVAPYLLLGNSPRDLITTDRFKTSLKAIRRRKD